MDELLKIIGKEPFYIFGTGQIGKRFYQALAERKLLSRFQGFLVSGEKPRDFALGAVSRADEIRNPANVTVLLAVHDVLVPEVTALLRGLGFARQIWAYPMLLDLESGEPVETGVLREPKALVRGMKWKLPLAIYYLAIEDCAAGNGIGRDAYLQLHERGCAPETARKRLALLEQKVEICRNCFPNDLPPIRLNQEEDLILDGVHRLMLAYYFDIPTISCNLYRVDRMAFEERMGWFGMSKC